MENYTALWLPLKKITADLLDDCLEIVVPIVLLGIALSNIFDTLYVVCLLKFKINKGKFITHNYI